MTWKKSIFATEEDYSMLEDVGVNVDWDDEVEVKGPVITVDDSDSDGDDSSSDSDPFGLFQYGYRLRV